MFRMLLLGAGVLFLTTAQRAPRPADPEPGVPQALAATRAARVSDVAYDLRFVVPAAASEPLKGHVVIRFKLSDAATPLALDFAAPPARISRTTA